MRRNIIIDTDAYKITHPSQYVPGLTERMNYAEARIGSKYPEICFFGYRGIIQDHFLQPVTNEMIEEAREESFMTFGTDKYFHAEPWKKVRDLGYLPIEIKALKEGTRIPVGHVLFKSKSTEDWFAPLIGSLEGLMMHFWYTTETATRAMYIKEAIKPIFQATCDYPELILPFAVNDFGFRGGECHESSARGGAGFLVHFEGSDNMPASRFIKDFYGMKGRGKSVWATEHSVAMSFGPGRGEIDYLLHQLRNCPPDMICSVVIDTYDDKGFMLNVVANDEVREELAKRTAPTKFRPDTGNPLTNVVEKSDMLASIFGFRMNRTQHKVLNGNVGLLQGDGMDELSIPETYRQYVKTGWGAENFITGSGGGLLQVDLNRDVIRAAIKDCQGKKNGIPFNMQKNPKSDPSKASKSGDLKLHKSMNSYMTIQSSKETPEAFNGYSDELETVLHNGKFTGQSFEDIIARANS